MQPDESLVMADGSEFDIKPNSNAQNAAYNILELTPTQRAQLERDGEIAIDTAGGGVTYISL